MLSLPADWHIVYAFTKMLFAKLLSAILPIVIYVRII